MLETKMLKDIDAVIFDMDGTLVDSMWIWPSIDRDFYAKYGLTAPESFPDDMEGSSSWIRSRRFRIRGKRSWRSGQRWRMRGT